MAPTQAVSPGMPSADTARLTRPSDGSMRCSPSPRGTTLRCAQSRKPQTWSPTAKRAFCDSITRPTTRETIGLFSAKPGA